MGWVAPPWWRRPGHVCKRMFRPGAPPMRDRAPVAIAVPVGRIVAAVIAARHAREMEKGARQVAARRARQCRLPEVQLLHPQKMEPGPT
jgi:hypothetical protein